ncbi:hypothetical protein HPG69_015122 [Diceros bicornis minor]|uniref:Swi5-dependent recombination DNA repair protein 1 homolog n=1 Tax=Diceros bicornis minor TaxID=77932 RepID=A0A7J7FLE8_DICBM|nr:hypothetical protein HPG69_015122 [Diceros bicornis minor]
MGRDTGGVMPHGSNGLVPVASAGESGLSGPASPAGSLALAGPLLWDPLVATPSSPLPSSSAGNWASTPTSSTRMVSWPDITMTCKQRTRDTAGGRGRYSPWEPELWAKISLQANFLKRVSGILKTEPRPPGLKPCTPWARCSSCAICSGHAPTSRGAATPQRIPGEPTLRRNQGDKKKERPRPLSLGVPQPQSWERADQQNPSMVKRLKVENEENNQNFSEKPTPSTEENYFEFQENCKHIDSEFEERSYSDDLPNDFVNENLPKQGLNEEKAKLVKQFQEKEDFLQRLKLVKMHRSKKNLCQLQLLIKKWRRSYELQSAMPEQNKKLSLTQLIGHYGLNDKLLHYNSNEKEFTGV